MEAVGVVLAAGLGSRVGADGNKAYLPLAGRSMLAWSLETLIRSPDVARTILVFRRGELTLARDTVQHEFGEAAVELVEGGDTRHASETNVVQYLAADIDSGVVDVVAIHDAARPLAGADVFAEAIALAREFGGALPALPVSNLAMLDHDTQGHDTQGHDTQDHGGLASVAQRTSLVRVQTPQAFRAGELLHAYRCAQRDGFEGTDTSSCVERYTDIEVRTFVGQTTNLKVTYPRDVAVAHHLLTDRDTGGGLR